MTIYFLLGGIVLGAILMQIVTAMSQPHKLTE